MCEPCWAGSKSLDCKAAVANCHGSFNWQKSRKFWKHKSLLARLRKRHEAMVAVEECGQM